ncbi:protein penguin [Contarinia nasturtii]|uniref:protein penguin n=1 Tax=Contarinia nasturtii TaxID=265458 RepID=UPI0012D3B4B3|nr:protein penguin [Contarinia nasturtii]
MSESKKRVADSGGSTQAKKPKFEKKSAPKFNSEKSGNPFKNSGNKFGKPNNKFQKPNGKFQGKFQKPAPNKFDKSDGQTQPAGTEKKDWNKFKQEKKELRLKRKAARIGFDKVHEAKQLYEKLKCKSTENKAELCRELHKVFKDAETYQKMVMAHDTTRIVQCMLKRAPAEICQQISEALIPVVSKLAICDYAHFVVPRLLKYGSAEIKRKVIEATYGNVFSMLSRPKSTSIIDSIYLSYASSQQKALMRQELYGDLYKKAKDKTVKCIKDTYKNAPHEKPVVLGSVKSNLNHIANKTLVDNSLVHAVLLDYLSECNEEDRGEIIADFLPHIAALASTKDGVRAAMFCFWHSIVKDRRAILKSVREHLIKLCTHEHGHVFILTIINSTDDTKALKKSIFDPIFAEIESVAANEWGRKVIDWFVAPEDRARFHPQVIGLIEEGLQYSKKDKEVRRTELLEQISEPLCKTIIENPYFWLRGGHIAITTLNILKNCKHDQAQKKALEAVADVICNVDWKVTPKEVEEENKEVAEIKKKLEAKTEESKDKKDIPELVLGVEHAGLHIALKKIMKIEQFPAALATKLTEEVVENWLPLNRATFLLIKAYEGGDEEVQQKIKSLVTKQKKLLKTHNHAGSKILTELLGLK